MICILSSQLLAPEIREALDIILDVYAVEHAVKAADAVKSPAHRELRQTFSRNAMDRLKKWLEEHEPTWLPGEPPAKAARYILENWQEMTLFLDRVEVPVDNNGSEAALRVVARPCSLCTPFSNARNHYLSVGRRMTTRGQCPARREEFRHRGRVKVGRADLPRSIRHHLRRRKFSKPYQAADDVTGDTEGLGGFVHRQPSAVTIA